jgi:hypothetical protein
MSCALHGRDLPRPKPITVNGVVIAREAIAREVQHHPASKSLGSLFRPRLGVNRRPWERTAVYPEAIFRLPRWAFGQCLSLSLLDAARPCLPPCEQGARSPQRSAAWRP